MLVKSEVGIISKLTFKQKFEGSEEVSHLEIWRKSILGKGNSLKVEACFPCLSNRKKASVAGEV